MLDLQSGRGRIVVKAAGAGNRHTGPEITAYDGFTTVLDRTRRASQLLHGDRDTNIFAIRYLEGSVVEGCDAAFTADTH
ncbi:hypothetical protein MMUR_35420 [Mycolicibacterium murale]|uniref:Aminoglycoside phosphotransferase n=1 Tax=Mycolicibacterium murale TaxID=182220 RepID=A0A7I9WQ51_9MYCO|nr:hypothetical protein [Mycolicibacterium murale]MCV7180387.1 hypothetical protein [Mycolicibacterium murale]GFG59406.1 hypothetical protein MMUR_35420 [Mycolicibacterium murale]